MKTNVHNLFVYGSLRSGFKHPAYEYISKYFTFVGNARVKGKLFDMGSYPAGVPVQEDTFITGELYVIKNASEFSWAIGQLDDYEGIRTEAGETPLYRRELADVYLEKETVKAWVYWYNGDVQGRPVIESGDLLSYIQSKK
ncbi:MAG TPA: gamma-glutamylcyclotransferase family protein [Chitinophagaceae bacterium]|nr:gamma-glutamylcyclotransferase family protein [Chitinophagaceae bacterium]